VSDSVSFNGSEAELPEFSIWHAKDANHAPLRILPDESAQISLFPTGHTPLDHQIYNFHHWAEKRLHTPAGQYMLNAAFGNISHPQAQRLEENNRTLTLYKETFSSFLWTGLECSNPQSPAGERWDQLDLTKTYNRKHRQKQIQLMKEAGIENVRLGMPNHRMVEQKNWGCFTRILNDFKAADIKVSLDLQHFGLPASFKNEANPEESLYLNPAWPDHFVQFSMQVVKKYLPQLDALTLINEPMITNRFSSCFWNEAMPGNMTDERYNHFFIKRSLLIAKAAVKTRYEIERYLQAKQKGPIIFIHNESCEQHADNPEFNDFGRFLASDLILGHEWLLEGDFTQTGIFKWMQFHMTKASQPYQEILQLIRQLQEIKDLHQSFNTEFDKTMKADTVFGIDYYAACETVMLTTGFPKATSVEDYTEQVLNGERLGLAGICTQYWNRYQLPLLHTETNFVDHGASSHVGTSDDWGLKQLIELAQLPKFGIPVLGFTWYSLIDQFNWHNGMQGSPNDTRLHPVGLYSWPEYAPRPFTQHVLPSLQYALNEIQYPVNQH
jgi:beta-glucosidase/6-phospho-beta-glucosidase/beta-galactosidase